jgi:choline-sulfatase
MLKGYFAAVTAMDTDVGRMLEHLEELGLRGKTLVVFMSDNGMSCGHHGFWGKGNGTWPRNMYENSVKVPAIFSHPGRIPQGKAQKEMTSAYDFMPTLLDYLNLSQPRTGNLPGASFLPLLFGQSKSRRENIVIYDEYGAVRMIRTHEWKYVHRYPDGPHELYDLVNDPDERQNLAKDVSQGSRIAELKTKLDEWFKRYVNTARDGIVDDGTDPSDRFGQIKFIKK